MRALVQRVTQASVAVDGRVTGAIGKGLLVLVGVGADDDERDRDWLAAKIASLRIFDDPASESVGERFRRHHPAGERVNSAGARRGLVNRLAV